MSCPVCFNAAASDDTVRQSVNVGIFVLMGVTGVVLAARRAAESRLRDPAAKDDMWTQNQLNLLVGRPVIVHLSSKDASQPAGL